MDNKRHMRKGFSLIELIVVIMIIAVLTMIIGLAWNNWIYRTRIKSANTKAKVIFNAAQTEAIKYSQAERLDPAHGYMTNGDYYFYWDGHSAGYATSDETTATGYSLGAVDAAQANTQRFANAINRIAGTDGSYKIWIKDYKVQSVAYVPNNTSRYLGSYPSQQSEPATGLDPKSLHTNMSTLVLP